MNWILMKDKLEPEEVIRLKLVNKKNKQSDEETSLISLACGLCFDFNPFGEELCGWFFLFLGGWCDVM